jgi:hypothetical protein
MLTPTRLKISVKANILGLIVVLLASCITTFLGLHATLLKESAISGAVIFAILQSYFTILLYFGVRPDNGYVAWGKSIEKFVTNTDLPSASLPDLGSMDVGDDLFGIIIGPIITILVTVVLAVFLTLAIWVGLNVIALLGLIIFVPMYYIFRRSLRLVLIHTRTCRGRLGTSALIAIRYAIPYSLLIGLCLWAPDWVLRKMTG